MQRFEASGWHTQYVDVDHGNDVATDRSGDRSRARTSPIGPSLIAVRTHIGFGSPRQDSYLAHGEPLGPDNVKKTKEELGWPLEPDVLRSRRRAEVLSRSRRQGQRSRSGVADAVRRVESRQRRSRPRSSNARYAGNARPICRGRRSMKSNGSVATRDAGGIVMNAIAASAARTRRRLGRSRPVDQNVYERLRRLSSPTITPAATFTSACASTAWPRSTTASRYHGALLPFGATFFNFLDYCKPVAAAGGALRNCTCIFVFTHDSFFLGEDGPTHQPIEQLAMLRATPNCRRRAAGRLARSARSVETGGRRASTRRGCSCSRARSFRSWATATPPLPKARTSSRSRRRQARPDPDRDRLGSLARDRRQEAARRQGRSAARRLDAVVGTVRRSRRQPIRIGTAAGGRRRMSIEAGATIGWSQIRRRPRAIAFGIDHFGASAPAADLAKTFGFTPDNIAQLATRHVRTRQLARRDS